MAWNYNRASQRIDDLLSQTVDIQVQGLADRRIYLAERSEGSLSARDALFDIKRNQAVVVDGVHVYAKLCNYDEFRLQNNEETEQSHKVALATLHLLYTSMDRLVQEFGAKRVDYHGSRLHCVVVEPDDNEGNRILRAVALAEQLQMIVAQASREFWRLNITPELAIGIDSGKCVAINSGSGLEREPLFLGAAANYSAKLAEANRPGIYLASRARTAIGLSPLPGGLSEEWRYSVQGNMPGIVTAAAARGATIDSALANSNSRSEAILTEWASEQLEGRLNALTAADFIFHSHTLPLKTLDYKDLSPSNSVRMQVVSVFADLDGYTNYIDTAMNSGMIQEAVRALHVIRGEFHNVLKSDFSGRKVRYIGDCINGLIASGSGTNVDNSQSVDSAIKCAVGMSESLDIIKSRVVSLKDVGLATGIEIGLTPISRIGIRGDRSVRVASSTATIASQREQEDISTIGLAIGAIAFSHLNQSAQNYFQGRYRQHVDYEDTCLVLEGTSTTQGDYEFRPHSNFK